MSRENYTTAFDATVEELIKMELRRDLFIHRLYGLVDNMNEKGPSYSGRYQSMFLAVNGMDDVRAELADTAYTKLEEDSQT